MCVAWYKEGQWHGSGIIWRGRCWNILSWITALYTGDIDGRTTDGRLEGGGEGKRGTDERGKREINRASRFFFYKTLSGRKTDSNTAVFSDASVLEVLRDLFLRLHCEPVSSRDSR